MLTGIYLCVEHARINATNQPMTVQPRNRFTRKIPIKSALWRASIVGRKYIIAERNRKVMFSPLSRERGPDEDLRSLLLIRLESADCSIPAKPKF